MGGSECQKKSGGSVKGKEDGTIGEVGGGKVSETGEDQTRGS